MLSKAANTLYTSQPIGEAPEGNGYGVKKALFPKFAVGTICSTRQSLEFN